MVVRKLSIALDEPLAAAAEDRAHTAELSLSAWIARAVERELAVEDGLAAVAEWETERGPLTPEELDAAARSLLAAGAHRRS